MAEIFTVTQMRDHARDVLQEWLKGYTDVMADGRQRRIEITDMDDNWIHVRVQRQLNHGGYDRQDKHYKIAVEVTEVSSGAKD